VVGGSPRFIEPHLHQGELFWLEAKAPGAGRCTLLWRRSPAEPPIELTPGTGTCGSASWLRPVVLNAVESSLVVSAKTATAASGA